MARQAEPWPWEISQDEKKSSEKDLLGTKPPLQAPGPQEEGSRPTRQTETQAEPQQAEPTRLPVAYNPPPLPGTPEGYNAGQDPPWETVSEDAVAAMVRFLQDMGPDRGPFKLERDGQQNQQLPGLAVPPWFMQVVNYITGHPMLPYHHDRPTAVRDMLFLAAAAIVQVIEQYHNTPDLQNTKHIIWHEANLRRELYVEEMAQNQMVEDLGVAARALDLRMQTGNAQAVYDQLRLLFQHVADIRDKQFWRPTFLRFLWNIPEVRNAMQFLHDTGKYAFDPEFLSWQDQLESVREQQRLMQELEQE